MNNENNRIKVALYCRIASGASQDQMGLEVQEQKLIDYAEKKGYQIKYRFKEQAGGLTADREMLNLIKNISPSSVNRLLVTDVSRISRDLMKADAFIQELKKSGIEIEFSEHPDYIPWTEHAQKLMVQMIKETNVNKKRKKSKRLRA